MAALADQLQVKPAQKYEKCVFFGRSHQLQQGRCDDDTFLQLCGFGDGVDAEQNGRHWNDLMSQLRLYIIILSGDYLYIPWIIYICLLFVLLLLLLLQYTYSNQCTNVNTVYGMWDLSYFVIIIYNIFICMYENFPIIVFNSRTIR